MPYIEEENLLKPRRGKTLPLWKGKTADERGAIKVSTRCIMLMKLFIALHWPTNCCTQVGQKQNQRVPLANSWIKFLEMKADNQLAINYRY